MHQPGPGLGKLIFELTNAGNREDHLDGLLARLFEMLDALPDYPVRAKGAMLMLSPRQQYVQVAQLGLDAESGQALLGEVLDGLAPRMQERAYLTSLAVERGSDWARQTDARFLVLPLFERDQPLGLVLFCVDPQWRPDGHTLDVLTDISHVLSSVVSRLLISETLKVRELELEEARADAIRRLGTASEYRDNETGMHVMRMTHYASAIAKIMGLDAQQREYLAIAAPMHDVGKIGISDSILLKPGKLTEQEFADMKEHTVIGSKLLQGDDPLIAAARDIALCHHEHWDGSGYPAGLRGEEIPILGRICAVADVFDALTSQRPYKSAWSTEEAVAWIHQQSGTKFDPAVVAAFDQASPEILRIKQLYREEIIDPNQVIELPEIPTADDQWIGWSEAFSVGIDVIDQHHRYLFDLVNDLHRAVVNKRGARKVAHVLKALEKYAQVHFNAEEKMMQRFQFPAIQRQHHQHRFFERKINAFYQELHVNPLTAQHDILTYLRDWLIQHIKVEDAKLRDLVGRHPVEAP
jgi:hemerythrin-like metal-binding protein